MSMSMSRSIGENGGRRHKTTDDDTSRWRRDTSPIRTRPRQRRKRRAVSFCQVTRGATPSRAGVGRPRPGRPTRRPASRMCRVLDERCEACGSADVSSGSEDERRGDGGAHLRRLMAVTHRSGQGRAGQAGQAGPAGSAAGRQRRAGSRARRAAQAGGVAHRRRSECGAVRCGAVRCGVSCVRCAVCGVRRPREWDKRGVVDAGRCWLMLVDDARRGRARTHAPSHSEDARRWCRAVGVVLGAEAKRGQLGRPYTLRCCACPDTRGSGAALVGYGGRPIGEARFARESPWLARHGGGGGGGGDGRRRRPTTTDDVAVGFENLARAVPTTAREAVGATGVLPGAGAAGCWVLVLAVPAARGPGPCYPHRVSGRARPIT